MSERRLAVVTGAASGIGHATAALLLARGHGVLATDVAPDGLLPLAAAGARTLVTDLATDVGRAAVVDAADGWCAAAGAPLDWLVNAAGMIVLKPIETVTGDDLRRAFDVNVGSAFVLTQRLGERMRDGGAIVSFSSPSAKFVATTEAAAYALTKAAVSQVTRSFAKAYAPRGIRVNALSPGITDTPMQARVLREVAEQRGIPEADLAAARLATVPMGRSAPPEEIAAVVAWLLSDEAAYMTGQVVNVDGGMVMW